MADELRHLEISTPTRTHVPELEQFAINQKPKSSDHRDLRLYRYGVSGLYQWWPKRDGSVFEDPCDEPFIISARDQGPGPGEAVAMVRRLVDASAALVVKAVRQPDDAAGLEEWTAAVTAARAMIAATSTRDAR